MNCHIDCLYLSHSVQSVHRSTTSFSSANALNTSNFVDCVKRSIIDTFTLWIQFTKWITIIIMDFLSLWCICYVCGFCDLFLSVFRIILHLFVWIMFLVTFILERIQTMIHALDMVRQIYIYFLHFKYLRLLSLTWVILSCFRVYL